MHFNVRHQKHDMSDKITISHKLFFIIARSWNAGAMFVKCNILVYRIVSNKHRTLDVSQDNVAKVLTQQVMNGVWH